MNGKSFVALEHQTQEIESQNFLCVAVQDLQVDFKELLWIQRKATIVKLRCALAVLQKLK